MASIAIIDYGMGNLHSIAKAVEHVAGGAAVAVTGKPKQILAADHVIFPGVGAIRDCMSELERTGLNEVVLEACRTRPLLGVCLGLQALFDHSEENNGIDCLGLISGQVRRFPPGLTDAGSDLRLKIPHMGWNQVMHDTTHALFNEIPSGSRFYFVHSYYAQPENDSDSLATTSYGIDFTSVVGRENVVAVQFHPEKSQHVGLKLLENFVSWNGES